MESFYDLVRLKLGRPKSQKNPPRFGESSTVVRHWGPTPAPPVKVWPRGEEVLIVGQKIGIYIH